MRNHINILYYCIRNVPFLSFHLNKVIYRLTRSSLTRRALLHSLSRRRRTRIVSLPLARLATVALAFSLNFYLFPQFVAWHKYVVSRSYSSSNSNSNSSSFVSNCDCNYRLSSTWTARMRKKNLQEAAEQKVELDNNNNNSRMGKREGRKRRRNNLTKSSRS